MAKKEIKRPALAKDLNKRLLENAKLKIPQIMEKFNSTEKGLDNNGVVKNRIAFGNNTVVTKKKHHWYNVLFESFINPFSVVLIIIAILNVSIPNPGTPDGTKWAAFAIIFIMIIIAGSLKLVQDIKSSSASEKLKNYIKTTTAVERNGEKIEIPFDEVVCGDIVHIGAGDMIPADMVIISAKDLFITQSSLTGESEPVEKTSASSEDSCKAALDCRNVCFMGTSVNSGSAKAIIVGCGSETYFGRIAKNLNKKRPKTNFDKGIKSITWLLIWTMLIMVFLIFILQGVIHLGDISNVWITALIFSLAVAVGLTPEMLPMIVTLNLAKEAIKLSKQQTIVKNINSIQSFGAMDVLCTDKTGTLTEDKIVLERHMNVDGQEDSRVLVYGYLNSFYQTGLKNLIDMAIISKAEEHNINSIYFNFAKVDEIPFDFSRRRMSVVLRDLAGELQLVTKGATEEILSVCSHVEIQGETRPLDDIIKNKIKTTVQGLNEQGMRVIAVAINNNPLEKNKEFSIADESNLKLIGYIALLDPPKESAKNAIHALQQKGVEVKILTGDNDAVARYTCNQVGIKARKVLLGHEVEKMSDETLKREVMRINVFAKLSPEQKARVVLAIKANRHVVGFMGDGINDALAMKAADLAISVDTAVDIAKESADIILLKKDLMILERGAIEGRKTYANIIKYIKMTVSSNFGNMLSMLIASLGWLNILPMQATQILILNMIYDISQFSIPWDNVDEEFIKAPRSWSARSILKFMLCIGPISSIFDVTGFLIMAYAFGWNDVAHQGLFNSGWFLISLLTQMSVIVVLRTEKIPIIKSRPSLPVVIFMTFLFTIGFIFVMVPGLSAIGFAPLHNEGWFFLMIMFVLIGYVCFSQMGKQLYIRRFHQWL